MAKTRKLITILILLLVPATVFAVTTQYKGMPIQGYIGNVFSLKVSEFMYGNANDGRGINLNYLDSANSEAYLIAPSGNPLSVAGLMIGTFDTTVTFNQSNFSEYTSATLTITHSKLIKTNSPATAFDYELAVEYRLNDGQNIRNTETRFCYSKDSVIATPYEKAIIIDLIPANATNGMCSIKNGGVYFRLTSDDPVNVSGDYTSTITFTLQGN